MAQAWLRLNPQSPQNLRCARAPPKSPAPNSPSRTYFVQRRSIGRWTCIPKTTEKNTKVNPQNPVAPSLPERLFFPTRSELACCFVRSLWLGRYAVWFTCSTIQRQSLERRRTGMHHLSAWHQNEEDRTMIADLELLCRWC